MNQNNTTVHAPGKWPYLESTLNDTPAYIINRQIQIKLIIYKSSDIRLLQIIITTFFVPISQKVILINSR